VLPLQAFAVEIAAAVAANEPAPRARRGA
jgi:hypothetical protein